ncbi:MAG TPA: carbon-nitrogen hydrolase family protein [Arenicellales bacterium]|nr:carbon-nitrogen hydrolase family protein [Arenicellales bacterium]
MTRFSIAAIQMDLPIADNVSAMAREVEIVKKRFPWVEMVLLAELSAFGPRLQSAQAMPGPAEDHFRAVARRHGIWLVPGSIYEMENGVIYNTAPVIDPKGSVVARYRKMFPFLPYETGVAAGSEGVVFDVPGVGRFGLSICYDMWFPETTRTLAWMGAEVILHPSLTNTIDREAELTIARASAITNQCYFIDVNNCGEMAYGRSIAVGPEGEIIHQAGETAQIMPVTVDFDRVRDVRRNGIKGLGQPLKSFRDSRMSFPPYQSGATSPELHALGELNMPGPSGDC